MYLESTGEGGREGWGERGLEPCVVVVGVCLGPGQGGRGEGEEEDEEKECEALS